MAHGITYAEQYRPRFHFSARKNWLNDPNGCVFYQGDYHLFFQHNPKGVEWGNMTWGHAVSKDLVRWRQLPHALFPYGGGAIFSGSAVVDWKNSSGLGDGHAPPLVAAFTHARKPYGQAIACSNDKGCSWKLYNHGEHVVPNQGLDLGERDPKIFWHKPTQKWVMALWVQKNRVRFFNSSNLREWIFTGDFVGEEFYECPDLFELPVAGEKRSKKWVLHDAAFHYWIGAFDGRTFRPEEGPFRGDFGSNFYAAQTWNNTAARVMQIAWMRGGKYPGMPFSQQMTFPCELTLRNTLRGIRLCRNPVREIKKIHAEKFRLGNLVAQPGMNPFAGISGIAFDIEMDVAAGRGSGFKIGFHGAMVSYEKNILTCPAGSIRLPVMDGDMHLRMLVDCTSLEVFWNRGEISLSSCFVPAGSQTELTFQAVRKPVRLGHVEVRKLRSIWE